MILNGTTCSSMKGLQLYTKQQQPWLQDQELTPTCQQQYRMIYQPETAEIQASSFNKNPMDTDEANLVKLLDFIFQKMRPPEV